MIVILFSALPARCTRSTSELRTGRQRYRMTLARRRLPLPRREQSQGAQYCPEKIAKAKELARGGRRSFTGAATTQSPDLAEARKLAKEAEGCGPQAVAAPPGCC